MTERVIRVTIDPSTRAGAAKVEADLKRIQEASRGAQGSISAIGKSASRDLGAASNSFSSVAKSAGGMGSVLKGLVGGASFAVIAGQAKAYAQAIAGLFDEYTKIQSQLRLVTTGTANLAAVQSELFKVAQETRSPFEETASLYSRVARNADKLGLSQKQILDITKTVSQAIQISGATASEAASGLQQLGQALGKGALNGDELNSILENTPRLAQAIAQGMGVTVGELKKLGAEGELTAQKVVDALQKTAPQIAKEFGQITPTISGAFVVLRNEVVNAFGKINEATGIGTKFAEIIVQAADWVKQFAAAITGTLAPTDELTAGMKILATTFVVVWDTASALVSLIKGTFVTAFKAVGTAAGQFAAVLSALFSGDFKRALSIAKESFKDNLNSMIGGFDGFTNSLSTKLMNTVDTVNKIWNEGARRAKPAQDALLNPAAPSGKQQIDTVKSVIAEIEAARRANSDFNQGPYALQLPDQADLLRQQSPDAGFEKQMADFSQKEFDRIKFGMKDFKDTTSEYAKEAARNIQSTFADFLFDPFKDGLDGMLQNFLDTMRRIAAEALAAKALETLGNALSGSTNPYLKAIGGVLSATGGRAEGGSVSKGVPYMVNEMAYQKRRPEVFIPNRSGRVVDQSKVSAGTTAAQSPSIVFVQNPDEIANALTQHSGTQKAMLKFLSTHQGEVVRNLGLK